MAELRTIVPALFHVACAALCAMFIVTSVHAQERRPHLTLIGIQSATVAPHGAGFAALSLTNKRAPGDDSDDGSAVVGLGFGNAFDSVGVQVAAHITSLENDFGDSGYFSLKFGKRLAAGPNPVFGSIRAGKLAGWGDAEGEDETLDVAITRFSALSFGSSDRVHPIMMTLGAGTKRRNDDTDAGIFAGIGIGLTETTSASVAWTGESVTIGTGFKFQGAENVRVNLSVDDVFDDVDNRRVILTVGYRFNNLFGG